MPYVKLIKQQEIAAHGLTAVRTRGDLNYFITTNYLIPRFLEAPSYATGQALWDDREAISEEISRHPAALFKAARVVEKTFDLAYREFYDRVLRLYEDDKAVENGDVYSSVLASLGYHAEIRRSPGAPAER